MDTVPGGDVNDAIAAAKYFRQFWPVEDRALDKQRSRLQIPRSTNIQNHRRIAPVEQPGYESLAEISRPAGQKHLH